VRARSRKIPPAAVSSVAENRSAVIEDELSAPVAVHGARTYAASDERHVIKPRIGNV
jgi:hypothetical protein